MARAGWSGHAGQCRSRSRADGENGHYGGKLGLGRLAAHDEQDGMARRVSLRTGRW
jgi:hypothetical protein